LQVGGDYVMEKYIQRSLEPVLRKAVGQFPTVVLTGPRQSAKTALLKHLFADKYGYVSLEPPDIRAAAREDPRGFLEMYPSPVIFDEVQYAPDELTTARVTTLPSPGTRGIRRPKLTALLPCRRWRNGG